MYTCIYNIFTCPYTYIHTHTYTHTNNIYICTHASTPGTTARQRLCEELTHDAGPGSSARLFCSRRSTTFSTSNARTSLYPLSETPAPLNPNPLFPTYPKAVLTAASAFLLLYTDEESECTTLKKFCAAKKQCD